MYFPSLKKTLVLTLLCTAYQSARATDDTYTNFGAVTDPAPQIDAINFVNEGTFDIFTQFPFDTSNTLNVTNRGTLTGTVGYRFDQVTGSGRRRSANFHNEGSVIGEDFGTFFITFAGS